MIYSLVMTMSVKIFPSYSVAVHLSFVSLLVRDIAVEWPYPLRNFKVLDC